MVKVGKLFWYYVTAIAFSLFFLLHGVNEQFGLISSSTIAELLLYYMAVAVIVASISKFIFKQYERALVFAFILLCIFFFFGAVKDFVESSRIDSLSRYSIFLPSILAIAIVSYAIVRRTTKTLKRAVLFIRTLTMVCVLLETFILVYNIFSHKEKQKDLGDIDHRIISNIQIPDTVRKPFIFWIVLDEYSGNAALKERWGFKNPLDSVLRTKGFFAAGNARSPYNYTHYSLVSSLDMTYLKGLKEHSIIGFRDIVRGNISLHETNVLKLLKEEGYNIHNYTIYNIKDFPTKANEYFANADFRLLDNQTLPGRIRQDLGWKLTDNNRVEGLQQEYKYRLSLVQEGIDAARKAINDKSPSFFMLHYMLTHEPFLYKPDGSLDTTSGFDVVPGKYVPSINYANSVLAPLVDSLKAIYRDRELVIIMQGDHGYKFDEDDPMFDQQGCSILYAVYCSDLNYQGWSDTFNSVNTFRILFNKYFHTKLPILENLSYNLYYR
jgi:hypothetical protein